LLKEDFWDTEESEAVLYPVRRIRMCKGSKVAPLTFFAKGIRDKSNETINGVRCCIDSARIESANAAIKHTQAKACGLFDAEYLFPKSRQIYLLRLRKRHTSERQ